MFPSSENNPGGTHSVASPRPTGRRTAPPWLRRTALAMSGLFTWTFLAALPAYALRLPALPSPMGRRVLSADEMSRLCGRSGPNQVPQASSGLVSIAASASGQPAGGAPGTWVIKQGSTVIATSPNTPQYGITVATSSGGVPVTLQISAPGTAAVGAYTVYYRYGAAPTNTVQGDFSIVQPATSLKSGGSLPWEQSVPTGSSGSSPGSVQKVNTVNGNKQTAVPLVGWTQRGGLPISLTLVHNSQSKQNTTLGQKWTHSFDLYGLVDGSGNFTVHWGDDLSYVFTKSGSAYTPPAGLYDSLVKNVDGTYTLTTKSQVAYHFNLAQRCDSITDENSNAITLGYSGNLVTTITDVNSRVLTLHYDASNRIDTITDPLSRQWTLAYNASNELVTLTLPVVSGSTYTQVFTYNAAHDITDYKDARGKHATYSYNADDSLAWEQDPLGNRSTWSYAGQVATKTDPNGHTQAFSYDTSLRLSQIKDNSGNTLVPSYDTANNKLQVQDQRGKLWKFTYDSRGNVLTSKDPYTDTTTFTYNSHNRMLTQVVPTGEETVWGYDAHDNLTSVVQKDSGGTTQATQTYTIDAHGVTTDYYDANSHHYQYGHNANGELTSLTTPNSHVTTWGVNGLGVRTSRQDALLRTTTYTLDNWLRVTTTTYPNTSTQTFTYDADNNVTQFVDASGTTTRTYDDDNRLLSESKGGSTTVSHTYDAVGKLGLLCTTTDANGRVLTYSYDTLDRLSSVAETAGTTTYGYDAASNQTSITNPNGTTVTRVFDDAGQVSSVTNKNSGGSVLSSFSYVYDTDNRRHTCTEASGDVVTYGYDWGSRLTSESRTGTNAYSISYTLDGVGNRTAQTKGTATTSFTLNNDDELTATSSSTGGFVNSYGYNANGEQTSRTLSGVAYTVAFDYDGQVSSLTQGASTVSFSYDAAGRRVSRTAGGVTTNFLYDGGSILLEKQGSTTTATYTYGSALVRKDGEYPLFDGQGSERTVTNSSQTVTGTLTQDGFGNTVATTGSSANPYMYAATSGYRNDGDAGLMHVGARYYDAQVGRFTSRDTFLDQKPYLYCEHDPVNNLDPTGHDKVDDVRHQVGWVIGFDPFWGFPYIVGPSYGYGDGTTLPGPVGNGNGTITIPIGGGGHSGGHGGGNGGEGGIHLPGGGVLQPGLSGPIGNHGHISITGGGLQVIYPISL